MMKVRDRWLNITKHAHQGMKEERPPVSLMHLQWAFEEPDYDDGKEIRKRIGRRTVRAYYTQDNEDIWVHAVSRTTRPP